MNLIHLEYIKNVNDDNGWAYKEYPIGAYFQLHFKEGKECAGIENHASNLPKGALIILSQTPPQSNDRYLTHIVELVNDGGEDKPQWKSDSVWGTFRWVKVRWVANFSNVSGIPFDKNIMKANWGWQDTKAKLLTGPNLMSQWNTIESLRAHLEEVFN